ncbi:MAG TPA: type II secretion system protein GspL [Burkholderiales bacterium]|nr:type II secretion system protein GspL [Burkholderiales bacterium]
MRSAASLLQLHLPEHWPATGAADEPPLRWALSAGGRVEGGVGRLAEIPPADETCLVLPVARVTFVRAALPPGPAAKLAKLAPFAIEDAIVSDPEDIVVSVLDDVRDGDRLVAVVDRAWLESVLAELAAHGIRPARAIVESALAAGSQGTWTVVWTGGGGFAALGRIEAIALDASLDGRPPLSLKLAADERRRRGDAPKAVRLLLADGADAPDTGRWAESLHVPVAVVGRWVPEETDAAAAACPNLLPGAGPGRWSGRELLARFKPAAILAVGILAVHGVLTFADWSRLAVEARGLRSDMDAAFRKAFPDAKAVVDPALQMRRNVADLRRAAGEPDATDFVPVLAKLAPALAAAGLRPQSLRYERGEFALDLAVGPDDTRERVASRLQVPGLRVQVERIAAGASGPVATVRIGAAS